MGLDEPLLEAENIQGNILRGFDSAALGLLGVRLPASGDTARNFLRALADEVMSVRGTHALRLMKSARMERFAPPPPQLNLALSFVGAGKVGLPTAHIVESFFKVPMGESAGELGDPLDAGGKPLNYVTGNSWDDTPDLLFLLGSPGLDDLNTQLASLKQRSVDAGCGLLFEEFGATLPGSKEHFGFHDGISQVGPRGRLSQAQNDYLTPRYLLPTNPLSQTFAKPGQPLVWPGQFVFGYPGQGVPDLPSQTAPTDGGEPWMKDGSFLVFRRLRQDVAAFRNFSLGAAATLSSGLARQVSQGEAEALLVGRWPDGTSLSASANGPNTAVSNDDKRINNFCYGADTPAITVSDVGTFRVLPPVPGDFFGQSCPRFAHVRKVNARPEITTDQPGITARFQMLRRGVPFGSAFDTDPSAERGLLFLAYMTSVTEQFRLLNSQWMNNPLAPEPGGPGYDLLVGQHPTGGTRYCELKDVIGNVKARLETQGVWVIPTGGGVFFSPSIAVLRGL